MVLIDVKYYDDPEIIFIIVQVLRNIIIIEQNWQVYLIFRMHRYGYKLFTIIKSNDRDSLFIFPR